MNRKKPSSLFAKVLSQARACDDAYQRQILFAHAVEQADAQDEPEAAVCIVGLAGIFQSGSGYTPELLRIVWPRLPHLNDLLARISDPDQQYFCVWGLERLLYHAVEYPEVPGSALEQAWTTWLTALEQTGGYSPGAHLRLKLHLALRMGRHAVAQAAFASLTEREDADVLKHDRIQLPGDTESFSNGERASDFGCRAYAQQLHVVYHCAMGDGFRAVRAGAHLMEGRSACELKLCAAAPREALAALLEPALREGFEKEAERAHLRGLTLVAKRPNTLGFLGHHLRYLVQTDRLSQARALACEAHQLPQFRASPFQRFHFLRGWHAILRTMDDADESGVASEAILLAQRFDQRNGNRHFTEEWNADQQGRRKKVSPIS